MRVVVQAHPARASRAEALASSLSGLGATTVYDPHPTGPPSALRTFLRVCGYGDPDDWLCVLQDDAVPCRGFEDAAPRACLPGTVVSLYAGKLLRSVPALRRAAARCDPFGPLDQKEYIPVVGVVLPPGLPAGFRAWAGRNLVPGYRHDDELLGLYCRKHNVRAVTTVPSLVNHDNGVESLAGHTVHGYRTAWCWSDDDMSDWNG